MDMRFGGWEQTFEGTKSLVLIITFLMTYRDHRLKPKTSWYNLRYVLYIQYIEPERGPEIHTTTAQTISISLHTLGHGPERLYQTCRKTAHKQDHLQCKICETI